MEDISKTINEEAMSQSGVQNEEYPVQDTELTEEEAIAVGVSNDCEELYAEMPTLRGRNLEELVNTERYGQLRALGLSAKEAFLATARSTRTEINTKSHLGTSVPRGVHAPATFMSAAEMNEAREIFSGLSDEDIRTLYRKVTK